MPTDSTILLNRFEFAHVLNNNTGEFRTIEGPGRFQLESFEELTKDGIRNKIRVSDGQFAVILNPFDAEKGDIAEGEREVRIGPVVFALHPGEQLQGQVKNEFVLTDDDALLLRTEKEAPNPLDGSKNIPAGTEVLLKGPCRYIPHKNITVKEQRKSISLSEDEGAYIQNDDTGEVRLVKGPEDFFVEQNESRWDKELTREELQALGYEPQQVGADSRVLAATPRERDELWSAVVIELEDNEALCIYEGDRRRVEFGPKKVFLGPHERPKVLFISGGVPVRPNVLKIAKLGLGPDFIRDRLNVRTKDNATLALDVTFRWQFQVDPEHPENLFALKDFVGYAAQTLSSEIREAAARHDFEAFHSEAASIVKRAVFGEAESRVFDKNGLEIFGIDVEGITPEDQEIAKKLTDTIKTTVDIVTRRQQDEAKLESERRLIEGNAKNEKARRALIELETENRRRQTIAEAETEAQALRLRAEAEAEAIRIRAEAEVEATRQRLKVKADIAREKLEAQAAVLQGEGGKELIELERARALKATDKLVVPADSKLVLGLDRQLDL